MPKPGRKPFSTAMFHTAPLDSVTAAMLHDGNYDCRTMGWNLYHDRRISADRFAAFTEYQRRNRTNIICGASMSHAVNNYHQDRVNKTSAPDFLDPDLNKNNFHDARPSGLPALHGSKLLVRVLNLSGLNGVYSAAKQAKIAGFDGFGKPLKQQRTTGQPPVTEYRSTLDWLDEKLGIFQQPSAQFDIRRLASHRFLHALLEFKNKFRHATPFQPVWATVWADFSLREWIMPARWPQMLGVSSNPLDPTWLLLLRYPVREAGSLVRPTQLDSGWYAGHFPTPPPTHTPPPTSLTGHPMDLDAATRPRRHLPEFIHQEVDHFSHHLIACARVPACPPPALPPPQIRHYHLLARDYNDVPVWTERPHPAFAPMPATGGLTPP